MILKEHHKKQEKNGAKDKIKDEWDGVILIEECTIKEGRKVIDSGRKLVKIKLVEIRTQVKNSIFGEDYHFKESHH